MNLQPGELKALRAKYAEEQKKHKEQKKEADQKLEDLPDDAFKLDRQQVNEVVQNIT